MIKKLQKNGKFWKYRRILNNYKQKKTEKNQPTPFTKYKNFTISNKKGQIYETISQNNTILIE